MTVEHATNPIEDYALLGDTRTAALVSSDGSVDWLCLPHFDGTPVFGRLVGGPEAGSFRVRPRHLRAVEHRGYRGSSATVETTWSTEQGRVTLIEAMVAELDGRLLPTTVLVRRVAAHDGPVDVEVLFDPRVAERHRQPRSRRQGSTVVCEWGPLALSLTTTGPGAVEPGRAVLEAIRPGRPLTMVLGTAHREPVVVVTPDVAWQAVEADERRWRAWCAGMHVPGRHRDAIVRSLLTLRLLTYSPSGAAVAAPTTSLPEELGGSRNWDYRYAWPRDAAIGVAAFLAVGKPDEARSFLAWLLHASRLDRPALPAVLTLHGGRVPPERTVPGWSGYAGSRPVRVGNGAARQHQLDGYGWVVDAAWLLVEAGRRLPSETWRAVRGFADEVTRRWHEPDAGIWEVRGDEAHHVHSKLMAWLAVDRALRIAETHPIRTGRRRRWIEARGAIAADLDRNGRSPAGGYVRAYGSTEQDAAVLLLPVIGIHPPDAPVVRATVAAVREQLGAGGPLLHRYPPGSDGVTGSEGAFLPCSFWLVQALALMGQVEEAGQLFEELLERRGPLGLYAEEIDPATGAHLGNYPQALTHAALVQAALALERATR